MELPADRPRESGESTPFPDLMNDPAYATNVEGNGKGAEEPDTCRICRGEGSDEEQLFYPCKCSGSIKFVHQACLVEWLSHSQKKYCELCKTPFRFTKLYDPNMPHELPAPLFVRQVLVHGFRTIVTWLRFGLVAFVWLVWLPWSMRAIWRALFWLADGRWPTGDVSGRAGAQDTLTNLMPNGSVIGVVSTALTSSTAAQPQATDTTSVPSPGPSMFSFSTGEPLMLTLIKKALSALFFPGLSSPAGSMTSDSSDSTTGSYKQRHPSWLSDVKFLNSLTPSPTFNNILIDTLEGQLITLLVVISFILVFLIREWVVQQQPMANIGDGEREAAVQLIANDGQNQPVEAPEPEPQHVFQVEVPNEETEDQTENTPDRDDGEHSETHFGASNETMDFEDTQPESSDFPSIFQGANLHDFGSGHHFSPQEFAQHGHTWPGADLFMDIWARANEDPEEVLRIIREEGREEDLRWIAAAMRTLQQNGYSPPSARNGELGQATSNSLGRVHSNDAAAAWFDEAGLMSEDARGSSARSPPNEGSWGSSSLPNSGIGDSINLGIPQQDFAFNFPGSAPNTVNPFESQPAQQASAISIPDETNTNPASIPSANDALDDNVEPSMSASQASPTDHSTAEPPKNLTDRVFDWFWGDITPAELPEERPQHDEEHIVEDPALEAPFVPAQNNRQLGEDGIEEDEAGAPEAADAGFNANDIDAIEDGDDLEGILELIGMQGPIFGLLQNGVFSALLISFTVAVGIWLPYLWGKIALVLLDNPVQLIFGVPMTTVSIVADVTLDTLIGSLGYVMYWASLVCKVFLSPLSNLVPMGSWIPQTKSVTSASLSLIDASSRRLKHVAGALFVFHESDVPVFSVLSHQALKMHEARIAGLFRTVYAVGKFIVHDLPLRVISLRSGSAFPFDYEVSSLSNSLDEAWGQTYSSVSNLLGLMTNGKWAIAGAPQAAPTHITVDADLAMWTTKDRVIAITMGYLLVSLLGLLYLRITGLISGVNRGQRIEGLLAEVLHQAGGVMKVIVIIGIEMIVFPLYCGALLDVALLPLFDKATVASRVDFTSSSPLTSLFVHWFIGTCYMFHFALFVSMCRKIMRNGVLYFIRDPDDPTFHPVRDVLERNINTQLRKIAFSALVYGALVIICLGGVVWGIKYAFDGVLPIHWSATNPVLEFPVDLLFYNFVMPFAIQSIKPSDGLHNLYDWWFHKCARFLRLSNFFFGETERWHDEEGHHVRRTWWDVLTWRKGDIEHPVTSKEQLEGRKDVYFARDGKFFRAPASDQVRIPKGSQVFMEVTEENLRVDGAPDREDGLHGRNSDMFAKVYIPPHFRARIAAFILLIWAFAAVSGVGVTIIPLVIGRRIMSSYVPSSVPVNDIYAFSAGLCSLGGVVYAMLYCRTAQRMARDYLRPYLQTPRRTLLGLASVALNGCRLAYIVTALCVLLPSMFALLMELYVLVPMHTYFGSTKGHVINFVQDWTLGVLYVQMTVKFVLWNSTSRPAAALNGFFRDGWLRPNVGLATRALVLPISLLAIAAITLPLVAGFFLNWTAFYSAPEVQFKVYRYTYPVALAIGLCVWVTYSVHRRVEIWRINIRDDVYLIGERLHNFSGKRAKDVGVRRVITG